MSTVAREYAEALFILACEENAEKEIGDSLSSVCKIFEASPEYRELLSSPAIPVAERAAIIDGAFRGNMPEHTVSFLQLLSEKGRMDLFSECAEEYRKLAENKRAAAKAVVTSAVPLTEAELAALKAKLEAAARAEAVRVAWERANLPPEIAALRQAQRDAAKTNSVTEYLTH